MKEVLLNGFIGDKYGSTWTVKADTIQDIFRCIECNYPAFKRDIIDFAKAGGDLSIEYGGKLVEDEDELLYSIKADTIVITPIPAGAKSGGAKILAAIAIVAVIWATGGFGGIGIFGSGGAAGTNAAAGAVHAGGQLAATAGGLNTIGQIAVLTAINLAMTGLMQVMAPDPSVDGPGDDKYLFKGPENTIPQNNIVPVLFGRMIVGGATIASGTVTGLHNTKASTFVNGISSGTGGTTSIDILNGGYNWVPLTDIGIRI